MGLYKYTNKPLQSRILSPLFYPLSHQLISFRLRLCESNKQIFLMPIFQPNQARSSWNEVWEPSKQIFPQPAWETYAKAYILYWQYLNQIKSDLHKIFRKKTTCWYPQMIQHIKDTQSSNHSGRAKGHMTILNGQVKPQAACLVQNVFSRSPWSLMDNNFTLHIFYTGLYLWPNATTLFIMVISTNNFTSQGGWRAPNGWLEAISPPPELEGGPNILVPENTSMPGKWSCRVVCQYLCSDTYSEGRCWSRIGKGSCHIQLK